MERATILYWWWLCIQWSNYLKFSDVKQQHWLQFLQIEAPCCSEFSFLQIPVSLDNLSWNPHLHFFILWTTWTPWPSFFNHPIQKWRSEGSLWVSSSSQMLVILGHLISIWPQYPRYFFARVHKQQLRSPDVQTHVMIPSVPTMVLFLCWLDVCKPMLEMKSHRSSWENFVLP